jgi:hypothetical protein
MLPPDRIMVATGSNELEERVVDMQQSYNRVCSLRVSKDINKEW